MFALAVGTLNVNVVLKIVHDYSSLSYFLIRNYIKKSFSHHQYSGHTSKSRKQFLVHYSPLTLAHTKNIGE